MAAMGRGRREVLLADNRPEVDMVLRGMGGQQESEKGISAVVD